MVGWLVGWYLGFDRRVSINSDYLRLGTLVQQYSRTVYTAVPASIYSSTAVKLFFCTEPESESKLEDKDQSHFKVWVKF